MKRLTQLFQGLRSLYSPMYLASLIVLLQESDYQVRRYLAQYWSMQDFTTLHAHKPEQTLRNRILAVFLYAGALLQTLIGLAVILYGAFEDIAGALPTGLAIIISYPVVWAHVLALVYLVYKFGWSLWYPKVAGRSLVCKVLENQVVRLRKKHSFTVIAVAGSVGKTSTKLAIAYTLEPSRRVIYQTGNYNDRITVPLVIFGQKLPNLFNVIAWTKIFISNERAISRPFFYDVAVLEIGTDHPGDIAHFAYLQPEVTVVTAVTPEHMEYFKTIDAVAAEELGVCDYSKQVLVNADDTAAKYLKNYDVMTYGVSGTKPSRTFRASNVTTGNLTDNSARLHLRNGITMDTKIAILGNQGVKIVLAAVAAAQLIGLSRDEITKGVQEIKPFAGRMQLLPGLQGSTIIDDSYNASPAPVIAALDVLYASDAPQRIAILGNMNELGDYSPTAHREVGAYCRPDKLDLVVTIGADANKYLAATAAEKGCTVQTFDSPYDAGRYVAAHLRAGAVVLVEGSQNNVFAEEAIKLLLVSPKDAGKLVRQSADWMTIKRKQFGSL